ncbi:MAG: mercuric reductase [Candidatus Obscuribacterales bacterium]|nr:mercuric reductase [Candidatus Obscuribacterales bacterium]
MESFDDIVLGGGKGGKSLAMALASAGHRVALIERGQIGGSCINVACIPTKTMVASAKIVESARRSIDWGVELGAVSPALVDIVERKNRVVKEMVDAHWSLFTSTPNMELLVGTAKFIESNKVEVRMSDGSSRELQSERIYINTGSTTTIPALPGLEDIPYLTSTSIMNLTQLPEHLVIIGGGYIALEFAQVFARLGSRVTVLLRGSRFLPNEDEDIASAISDLLSDDGIELLYESKVKAFRKLPSEEISIDLEAGLTPRSLTCSHVLVAVGRTPNTKDLNLEVAGVDTNGDGSIKVDDQLRTSAKGVWAIGDCNGGPLFTHVSWDDFRILRDNVLHSLNRSTVGRLVPYTLFIDPELGRVGLTEEQARRKGYDILVAKLPAQKIPRAKTSGEQKGMLKAVVDKQTEKILGCSLLCHSAGEVMSVVQVAMLGGLTYRQVRDIIFTHPTMAESLNLLFATI